jgi:hypothetical protein
MKNFFIKCDDATLICDKKQYKEASLWERIKLSYHLLVCKNCRVYPEQNAIITEVLKIKAKEYSQADKVLLPKEKELMRKELQKKL